MIRNNELTLSEEDKKMLINTINKKGFFLEEKAYGMLEQRAGLFFLSKNFVPGKSDWFKDARTEIDLVFSQEDKEIIIECKKTDFAWIFPKSLVGSENVNFIYEIDGSMDVRSFDTDTCGIKGWQVCYSEPMPIMMNDNETLIPQDKEGKFVKTQSRQEDPIQRAALQVLHQLKIYKEKQKTQKPYAFFIPVILTNAPLLFLDYDEKHRDENSNLTDYNFLKKVNVIIYNYPEILDWITARREERPLKSVFIVNINYFTKFLDWLIPLFMGYLNQGSYKSINK